MVSATSSSSPSTRTGRAPAAAEAAAFLLLAVLAALAALRPAPPCRLRPPAPAPEAAAVSQAARLLFFRPMDANTVTAEELTLLPGVGDKAAWRLVRRREELGFFVTMEELADPAPGTRRLPAGATGHLAVSPDGPPPRSP